MFANNGMLPVIDMSTALRGYDGRGRIINVIAPYSSGFIATQNFDDVIPVWRFYKRFGWAKRYANSTRPGKRVVNLCKVCGAIRISNIDQCPRCGSSKKERNKSAAKS